MSLHPRRSRNCPRDIRLYRETSGAISSDDGSHNWVSSPGRNRLRGRMVSSVRVLARTRSLYGAEDTLIFSENRVWELCTPHFFRIVHPREEPECSTCNGRVCARHGLSAGGNEIRTAGPPLEPKRSAPCWRALISGDG